MASSDSFQDWFPSYRSGMERVKTTYCEDKIQDYLNGSSSQCIDVDWPKNCIAGVVVDCLLSNMPESWKASMAGSSVLLGVLPTLISLLGSTTVELGLLSLQRPILAFLLSIGSPAVGLIRTLDYADLPDLLEKKKGMVRLQSMSDAAAITTSIIQYTVVCGCIANVALVNWQLCIATVNSIAPATQFFPSIWHITAFLVYIVGTVAVRLRFRILRERPKMEGNGKMNTGFLRELQPCRRQSEVRLQPKRESYFFIFMAWLAYVGGVAHIVIGTLLFSSMLFIGVADAAIVLVRYCISTAICRMILQFETCGMRETIIPDDKGVYDSASGDHKGGRPMVYEGAN